MFENKFPTDKINIRPLNLLCPNSAQLFDQCILANLVEKWQACDNLNLFRLFVLL